MTPRLTCDRQLLAHSNDARKMTTDAHARYFGTELTDSSLVPESSSPQLGAMRFEEWLNRAQ